MKTNYYFIEGSILKNRPDPGPVKRADGMAGCPIKQGLTSDHTLDARKFYSGIGMKGRLAYTRIGGYLINSIVKTGRCCLS